LKEERRREAKTEIIKTIINDQGREEIKKRFEQRAEDIKKGRIKERK
jgi:hypothetical protein